MEKVHAESEAHFEILPKALCVRTAFGPRDAQKVHAFVAQGTFRSQHVKNRPRLDHSWKPRDRYTER